MALFLVTAPTGEPVDVETAKAQIKMDGDDDHDLIASLCAASREYVENTTGRKLFTQTWDLKLDGFPCGPIALPFPPVTSVTSVTYVDLAGDTQTWTAGATGYTTDLPTGPHCAPARIYPSYQQTYPSTRSQPNAVTVRFVCGYGTEAEDVPSMLLVAQKALIDHWYYHRGVIGEGINAATSKIPVGVDALLWPFWARS